MVTLSIKRKAKKSSTGPHPWSNNKWQRNRPKVGSASYSLDFSQFAGVALRTRVYQDSSIFLLV